VPVDRVRLGNRRERNSGHRGFVSSVNSCFPLASQCPFDSLKTGFCVSAFLKRLFDIFCSAAGLVLLSPLLFWLAWRSFDLLRAGFARADSQIGTE
jgi:hypothetical protein